MIKRVSQYNETPSFIFVKGEDNVVFENLGRCRCTPLLVFKIKHLPT